MFGFRWIGGSADSCRGHESADPPTHLNPNMDSQPRHDPPSPPTVYAHRRPTRTPADVGL